MEGAVKKQIEEYQKKWGSLEAYIAGVEYLVEKP
jgi:hypothetical protein